MKKPSPSLLSALIVLLLVLRPGSAAPGPEANVRILLLPFNIYAPPDFDYLKDGIAASLNSRLRQPGMAPIIPTEAMMKAATKDRKTLSQETIQTIAASLGANFAVEGHVTIVGGAVSTAIQLWQVPGGESRLNFHAKGDRPEAVLDHLDQFIGQLEAEVIEGGSAPAPPPPAKSITALQKRMPAPAVSWQSERLETAFTGMAIADLTPRPGREIALIDGRKVAIFRRQGGRLKNLAQLEAAPYLRLVAIDAADVDADGRAEIYVTAFHPRLGKPRSFVAQWSPSDKGFRIRSENLPFYFRVASTGAGKTVLMGQGPGSDDFFGQGPAPIQWAEASGEASKGGYKMGVPLPLPIEAHIYAFVRGAFLPGDGATIVTLSHRQKMRIYQSPDQSRWTSEESFGGGSIYLDESQTFQNRAKQIKQVGEETIRRLYLSPRMLLADLDGDGSNELLVVHNKDAAGGLFRRTRLLTSGRIDCLAWQPLGPITKWETPKVSGYISDLALDDTNGDSQRELIYLVVEGGTDVIGSRQCYLVVHDLTGF